MQYTTKIAGVTFPNTDGTSRQEIISRITRDMACRLEPEPTNAYDPNAIAVKVATAPGVVEQVGYIPKNLAAVIAPHLQGENLMVTILEITGGFETSYGDTASLGMKVLIDIKEQMPPDSGPKAPPEPPQAKRMSFDEWLDTIGDQGGDKQGRE